MNLLSPILTKAAIIVIAIMAGVTVYLWRENKNLNQQVSTKTAQVKSYMYGTATYKDEANKWHSISIEQSKSVANLKGDKDSINISYLKLLKLYKIKPKEVTGIGSINTEFKDDTSIVYKPTVKDTTYDLSTLPYITEKIRLHNDSLSRDLQIINKQSLLWHTKRETLEPPKSFFLLRWFQKKQNVTYVDIINDNPFIKTTNQNFQIITK